jgi:hypothetical protein
MKKAFGPLVTIVLVLSLLLVLPLLADSTTAGRNAQAAAAAISWSPQYTPIFEDPSDKLEETSGQGFTKELYAEALAYEPLLEKPGTQVNMGYWSAKGNHGSLVRVLDSLNDPSSSTTQVPERAVWDEGATSSYQYPSYDRMLEEHWYDRDGAEGGKVAIFGVRYTDPHPVTTAQADRIWGQYSQRYTDMAALFERATGKPVKAWCFVQGAKANRIFYKYELPELRSLERRGAVQVYFAKTQDADWIDPADWIAGTANAPAPLPAQ